MKGLEVLENAWIWAAEPAVDSWGLELLLGVWGLEPFFGGMADVNCWAKHGSIY